MSEAQDKLTVTITHVGKYGVTAERNWGGSDPTGTRFVQIHEGDSPGITRHKVGDVIEVAAHYAGPYLPARLKESPLS